MYPFFHSQRGLIAIWLLLAGLVAPSVRAQTWQQALAGHYNQPAGSAFSSNAHSVTDAQGNVFVTGSFTGSITVGNVRLGETSGNYLFVGKWSPTAKTWLWATTSGGFSGTYGSAIALSGNNVYVTGSFYSTTTIAGQSLTAAKAGTSSTTDIFLAKFVDNGTSFSNGWAVRGGGTNWDGGSGLAVVGTSVYVTGGFQGAATIADQTAAGTNVGYYDTFVAKYTDQGTSATGNWVATGGGATDDFGTRVVATASGDVYTTGTFTGTATVGGQSLTSLGGTDTFLQKITDQGSTYVNRWVVRGGGTGADTSTDLALVGSNLYTTGAFIGSATQAGRTLTSKGGTDLYVAKYADQGATVAGSWALAEGGAGNDGGTTLVASNSTLYVGGSFQGTATIAGQSLTATGVPGGNKSDVDGLVMRYTDLGSGPSPGWAVNLGGTGTDDIRGLSLGSTGVLYAVTNVSSSGAYLGTAPAVAVPSGAAVLTVLDPATGAVQRVDAPYQGGSSVVQAVTRTACGDVFLAGYFTGTVGFGRTQLVARGGRDIFLAKWNAATADWAWAVAAGGNNDDQALAIAVSGNNVYVTGNFYISTTIAGQALAASVGNYSLDLFIAKYVDQGSSVANGWAISTGGNYTDAGSALVASGSTLYVAGFFVGKATLGGQAVTSTNNSTDMFVAKYTDNGNSPTGIWVATGGGAGGDYAYGLALSGSMLYVAGDYTAGANASIAGQVLAPADPYNTNGFVAKFVDQGGTYTNGWATSMGGTADQDGCRGVAVVGTSVYVAGYYASSATVAGQSLSSLGDRDVFVAKYQDQDNTAVGMWAASGGGTSYDMATALASDGTGVYLTGYYSGPSATFAGQSLPQGGYYDIFVAYYADQGSTYANGWAVRAGGINLDYAYALALTDRGVYVGGSLEPVVTVGSTTFASPSSNDLNFLGLLSNDAAPLPVQLVAFTARATAATAVQLAWTTASEVKSASFAVERSYNGVTFTELGRVDAAGSSTTTRTYSYLDAALPAGAGTCYYRLRQLDLDGTATYSPVRTVVLTASGLVLYPNPARHSATLRGAVAGSVVQVYNLLGSLVLTTQADEVGKATLVLPTSLPSGMYLVRNGKGPALQLVME